MSLVQVNQAIWEHVRTSRCDVLPRCSAGWDTSFGFSMLNNLYLGANELGGMLPTNWGENLYWLMHLEINDNHISGSLPAGKNP